MIRFKKLTMEEMMEIYQTYLVVDFPKAELKPLSRLKTLAAAGRYVSYCFYEEERLVGYAFLFHDGEQQTALLDYYAIMSDQRGGGYGQKIIRILADIYKEYQYIVLEAEDPEDAIDEAELQIRTRRIHFYKEKCGLQDAGFKSHAFGVVYKVLVLPCKKEPADSAVHAKMISIYKELIPEPYYSQEIRI